MNKYIRLLSALVWGLIAGEQVVGQTNLAVNNIGEVTQLYVLPVSLPNHICERDVPGIETPAEILVSSGGFNDASRYIEGRLFDELTRSFVSNFNRLALLSAQGTLAGAVPVQVMLPVVAGGDPSGLIRRSTSRSGNIPNPLTSPGDAEAWETAAEVTSSPAEVLGTSGAYGIEIEEMEILYTNRPSTVANFAKKFAGRFSTRSVLITCIASASVLEIAFVFVSHLTGSSQVEKYNVKTTGLWKSELNNGKNYLFYESGKQEGMVAIGTTDAQSYRLYVNGATSAEALKTALIKADQNSVKVVCSNVTDKNLLVLGADGKGLGVNLPVNVYPTTSLAVMGHTYFYADGQDLVENWTDDVNVRVDGDMVTTDVGMMPTEKWPDYVFGADYPLTSAQELRAYLAKHKHLPAFPAQSAVAEKQVYHMNEHYVALLQQAEELTLRVLQKDQQLHQLTESLTVLKQRIQHLQEAAE